MALEPILEASNIVKVLGTGAAEVRALKGVSLELMPGELTLLDGTVGERQDHSVVDSRLHPHA